MRSILQFATLMVCLSLFGVDLPAQNKASPRVKPANLDRLNTTEDENDPHLSPSGQRLFYTHSAKEKSEVMASTRLASTKTWGPGKPFVDLQGKADYRAVFMTAENRFPQFLYFCTNKDPEKADQKGNNYDIYFLIKQFAGADFTNPTPVHAISSEREEMFPWLSTDGRELYFSRKDQDGWRLYRSRKPATGGPFEKPETLDLPVGFHHATLSPNGKLMYLQGPLEKERSGLFVATNNGKAWSQPEPLAELNDPEAPSGDQSPSLSRDGAFLYFASDRAGGKGGLDLWIVPTTLLNRK